MLSVEKLTWLSTRCWSGREEIPRVLGVADRGLKTASTRIYVGEVCDKRSIVIVINSLKGHREGAIAALFGSVG